ncbi:MAG: TrkA family potassium uptake protein [Phycisphaerales bacterium]|nr:TrkA family potassium uptake protein [Phycisphaerales bacterium]
MERFAVIGLGRFGSRLAANLSEAGAEVIAVDLDRRIVEEMRDRVALAIAMDATDEQALRIQGVDQVDVAVVGIGQNFEANALTTVLLKSLDVRKVVSRAANRMQAAILTRVGADAVVNPEDESADRWANLLLSPFIVEHVELAEGYGLVQMPVPPAWVGKRLHELNLRHEHRINIVAIKRPVASPTSTGEDAYDEHVVDLPMPQSSLSERDILIVAGHDVDLRRIPQA